MTSPPLSNGKFSLVSSYSPAGDQPQAIEAVTSGLRSNQKHQTILGVTGSGKTFTMANIVAQVQRPTLVIVHNKTLAAQLCAEFQEFFPKNAVSYFVSYYDYYQPEAYLPASDTYIEKEAQINEEIDRLRHAATMNLLTRRDVLIVASVSCIYGLGDVEAYLDLALTLTPGETIERDTFLRNLTDLQYTRARADFRSGMFTVMGDIIEVIPPGKQNAYRFEFFGDEIEKISETEPLTGEIIKPEISSLTLFPAKHAATTPDRIASAIEGIRKELDHRYQQLKSIGKDLEAARLHQRVNYDLELLQEVGYVNGIENYTRYLSGRPSGSPPATLLEYFPSDFLLFIDESHMTIPQLNGMHNGNFSRKSVLVEHGFRLPSAHDNRPLKFEEFESLVNQAVYVSATPGAYEKEKSASNIIELVVRPTGLVDPVVEVRPSKNQIDDLLEEIRRTINRGERTLITTLTKRSSEELNDYLLNAGLKVSYLHSDIDTLERIEILHSLRTGEIDVVVGINLLREGLDLPEVSFIAILDADSQGFLRSRDSLIQTIGRAARNINGHVVLYADRITPAMSAAMQETSRRRQKQLAHNKAHNITPQTIQKALKRVEFAGSKSSRSSRTPSSHSKVPLAEIPNLIESLKVKMEAAAAELDFETATSLRNEISRLQRRLKNKK